MSVLACSAPTTRISAAVSSDSPGSSVRDMVISCSLLWLPTAAATHCCLSDAAGTAAALQMKQRLMGFKIISAFDAVCAPPYVTIKEHR
jgi:hypothetical protein